MILRASSRSAILQGKKSRRFNGKSKIPVEAIIRSLTGVRW
jgi:hypothetical protein